MTMIISKRWYFRAKAVMVYGLTMMLVGIWIPDNPFASRFLATGIVLLLVGVVLLVFKADREIISKPYPGETMDD